MCFLILGTTSYWFFAERMRADGEKLRWKVIRPMSALGGGEADLLWSWKQNGLFCEQDGLFCEISFSFYKNTYFYFNILPLIVWFSEFSICVLRLRLIFIRFRIKKGSIVVSVAFCVSVSCGDDVFLCAWRAFGMKILWFLVVGQYQKLCFGNQKVLLQRLFFLPVLVSCGECGLHAIECVCQ